MKLYPSVMHYSHCDGECTLLDPRQANSEVTEPSPLWASPISTTIQTIIFGLIASLVALTGLYIAWQQLSAMRQRNDEVNSVTRSPLPIQNQDISPLYRYPHSPHDQPRRYHTLLRSETYTLHQITVQRELVSPIIVEHSHHRANRQERIY